ncbi:MAG TPA: FHA domain-containing protein [Nannocystis sp.]
MGRLRQTDGADRLLRGLNFIGRSRACTICLDRPEVSGEHAVLRWTGSGWEIKDLHSRNGVYVDGHRLPAGERAAIGPGCRLGFGRDGGHELVDAGEPIAFADPLTGAAPLTAVGGILALPDPDAPEVTIFRAGADWAIDRSGETAVVGDGELVRVGDQVWRVHLPELLTPTDVAADLAPQLDDLLLRFSVSRDEEYVELVAVHDRQTFDLKVRSHHYPLLLLARARLRQHALPPARQGWVHQHELLELLRVDRNQLHLDIFRVRRQLGALGIRDAARVVERRGGTSQLRIGASRIEIVPLGG